jgi:ABC-2 type transport system permease protein
MTDTNTAPARRAASGTWIVFVRHVQVYRHAPGLLLITLAAPLGMLLLFGYVFGGSLAGSGDAQVYRAFLVPGVFVLVAAMGLTATAMSANADVRSGLTDRFRSLPMSSRSVPGGLAAAETATGVLAFVLMGAVGLLVGWRIDAGVSRALLAVVLLVAVRFVLSWLGILLGLAVRNEQMVQQLAPLIFGTVMLSNVFTPTDRMPDGIRQFVEWNPISAITSALRELFGNAGAASPSTDLALPLQHPVLAAFIWCAALLAIAVPLATRRYRRAG